MLTRITMSVLALLVLAGCARTAPDFFVPTAKPITSTLTCQQFGQAASVISNAVLGNAQGSVTDEKMQSEVVRGKELLDAIEVEPDTELAAVVEALRPITAEDLAAEAESGPESEWDRQFAAFSSACDAAGDQVELTAPGG